MSEAAAKPPDSPAGAAAKAGPALPLLASAAAGGLVIGAVCGMFLLGPMVRPKPTAAPAASHGEESEDHGEEGGHGASSGAHGEGGGHKSTVFRLDNIIVNPAGSQGARFLMASVAVEVPDSKMEEKLRGKEVQVRDAVISILESHSLQQLTLPGARDSLRARITETIVPMAGSRKIKVYLPQFVIQ